jgi:hypothetical protein
MLCMRWADFAVYTHLYTTASAYVLPCGQDGRYPRSSVLFGGNWKVLVVDFFAGCWRVSASVHVVHGITGLGLSKLHLRCHTYSTRV